MEAQKEDMRWLGYDWGNREYFASDYFDQLYDWAVQLIRDGGWTAVPWNLLVYDIPGVLIGGQIGPRLQGYVSHVTMRRAISVLFILLAIAMTFVAWQKSFG